MRRLVIAFLTLILLAIFVSIRKEVVPTVEASPDIHQGDLVLQGNNVTIIEGRFDINGSIIVEENATLILRNAILNFSQTEDYEFNMTFWNPAIGNPRLQVDNATITSNDYYQGIFLYENSSAQIDGLTTVKSRFFLEDSSLASFSNSVLSWGIFAMNNATLNACNSSIQYIWAWDKSSVNVSNSTIASYVDIFAQSANLSIVGLRPGHVSFWSFQDNCSVVAAPNGLVSNVVFENTDIGDWSFEWQGFANVTISDSRLRQITIRDSVVLSVHNSYVSIILSHDNSVANIYDSTNNQIQLFDYSKIWLMNSTSDYYSIQYLSEVYVCWYLDFHVVDSIGQNVPSATVTATYPNATLADWRLTDASGWTRLTLMEKMMNATGEYVIANYFVEATYESHSNSTETMMMTGNRQITIPLPFIIPEFPSFLILSLFMITTLLAVIVYKRKHIT